MAKAKAKREHRRQLGQWMTPISLASDLVESVKLTPNSVVLEPSFGTGSFLIPLIKRFMDLHSGKPEDKQDKVFRYNVFGTEIDRVLYRRCLETIGNEFGSLPKTHNLHCGDFFASEFLEKSFDLIIGNPPFGGTFDPKLEDLLDKRYGQWNKYKIKKETYSFFISRSLDLLAYEGTLLFISSDTFLTIKTMSGLRKKLLDLCDVRVERLTNFSEETGQPMVILRAKKVKSPTELSLNGHMVKRSTIDLTDNLSWTITDKLAKFFEGPKLSEFVTSTSGMTVGRNELFIRKLNDGYFIEPYIFEFFDDPIRVSKEVEKARLKKVSYDKLMKLRRQELEGETRRNVRISLNPNGPVYLKYPHPDYALYNKSCGSIIYAEPTHVIYWRDQGDAVLTYKKNSNWYLHGVGGKKYFGKEGLTWQLVSQRLNMRYLPEGYILDSGAPCAFLKPQVPKRELYFILAWCLSDLANRILKTVLNHTRNIQSKDLERMPYPFWVTQELKSKVIAEMIDLLARARNGECFDRTSPEIAELSDFFSPT